MLVAGQFADEAGQAAVADDGAARHFPAIEDNGFDFLFFDDDAFGLKIGFDVNAVAAQFFHHHGDHQVSAASEGIDAFAHKVAEDNAVGDGWLIKRRAVGIGDRLHQEAPNVGAAREEAVEEVPGRFIVLVVEIHVGDCVKESLHSLGRDFEMSSQEGSEVTCVES